MELKLNHTRTFEKLEVFGRYLTRRTDSALVTPNTPRLRLGVFGVTRAVSVLLVRYHQNNPRAKPSGYFVEIPLVTPNTPRLRLGVFGVTRAESVLLIRYRQNILLKYHSSPQIPLGFALGYLG